MERGLPSARTQPGAPGKAPRTVCAERLFGGEPELRIQYLGQEYRLRKTRNGKLILTK